jgi:hypothetical protein
MARRLLIKPPIIAFDRDGWISVFDSPDQAQQRIEAIDVEDEEYLAYDATGNKLQFEVIPEDVNRLSRWSRLRHQNPVQLRETGANDVAELKRLLASALKDVDKSELDVDASSLNQLVSEVTRRSKTSSLRAQI